MTCGSALSQSVETGASRREAAERFEVSVASAVKWLQRWYQQRSAAPKPRGGRPSGEMLVAQAWWDAAYDAAAAQRQMPTLPQAILALRASGHRFNAPVGGLR